MKKIWANKNNEETTKIALKRWETRRKNGNIISEQHKQNISKSLKGLKKKTKKNYGKPVLQYDLEGNYIQEYFNCMEAGRQINKNGSSISDVASGKQKTAYGFKWKYK